MLSPILVWDHPSIEALARHLGGGPAAAPERARHEAGRSETKATIESKHLN